MPWIVGVTKGTGFSDGELEENESAYTLPGSVVYDETEVYLNALGQWRYLFETNRVPVED
jgi:hypothetical protein